MVCGMSPAQPAHCALPKPSPPAPPHPTLPQYKLTLSDDLQLEPTVNRSTWDSPPAATGAGFIHQPPVPPRIMSRLQSWPAEAAAEAVAAARAEAAARQRQLEEEPEILNVPPAVAASLAAEGGSAAAAAAGSPSSPPAVHGPQQATAASPRQASLTPRHSRGWELL